MEETICKNDAMKPRGVYKRQQPETEERVSPWNLPDRSMVVKEREFEQDVATDKNRRKREVWRIWLVQTKAPTYHLSGRLALLNISVINECRYGDVSSTFQK